jgi:hypothetical protein
VKIEKNENQKFGEIALTEVSADLVVGSEYKQMISRINEKLPAIIKDTQNFYKSSSQFKSVTLDVTELTPISSLKHILAIIDQTKRALEEAHIKLKRKQIELQKKTAEYDSIEEGLDKELLWLDILEINSELSNIENLIKGSLRKLSFFTTQYQAIMDKLGISSITEEEYEKNEAKHHIMTALKQALCSARTRGGIIDEGNHIYLFEMGINGAVAQAEILGFLQYEQELLSKGEEPTHKLTIKWLNDCADKFLECGIQFAESRGFIPLDKNSLTGEITNG